MMVVPIRQMMLAVMPSIACSMMVIPAAEGLSYRMHAGRFAIHPRVVSSHTPGTGRQSCGDHFQSDPCGPQPALTQCFAGVSSSNGKSNSKSRPHSAARASASTTANSVGMEPTDAAHQLDSDQVNGSRDRDVATVNKNVPFPLLLWRFSRPHTLIGSALAIPALHCLAAPTLQSMLSLPMLTSVVFAMIPSLLMNVFITGLNQITDVEIDKINKPYLPIAAGDLSQSTATVVVLACLLASLSMGAFSGPLLSTDGLNVALWGSAVLGTMYSLPPFRLKRFPLLAAFCIVAVRGTIINAGFFAHARVAAFGQPLATALGCVLRDRRCMLSSVFFGIFGIVIALMKDVPDVKGDEQSNIRSFSVRVGQKKVFRTMRRLLTALFATYGVGFLRSALDAPSKVVARCRMTLSVASFLAGWSVRSMARGVKEEDSGEVYQYYMYLWKLFYLSYLALPFAR